MTDPLDRKQHIAEFTTPKDVAAIAASFCRVEVHEMGSSTKRNMVVQARELFVLVCCDLDMAGDTNWGPIRDAIGSTMIDRAFRQMRQRGEQRQENKGADSWFARTRDRILGECEQLADHRAESLPGMSR